MGEGRAHYLLFFPSKENPDTQVRSHCSVVEIIDSRINIGISRMTCCVSQNFWNSENDEVECIINCEAFFYEGRSGGKNYRSKNKFRCRVNREERRFCKLTKGNAFVKLVT